MDYNTQSFQKKCMRMFFILLVGVVVNFGLNGYAALKHPKVRAEITQSHAKIEKSIEETNQRLIRVEQKVDRLLQK